MPLVPSLLKTEMVKFSDKDSVTFTGWPTSIEDAANLWADALVSYVTTIVPPSTTFTAAKAAFVAQFITMTNEAQNGFVVLKVAFTNFAINLSVGMAGFLSIHPPIPILIESIQPLAITSTESDPVLTQLISLIDTWFRTGLAGPLPSGAPLIPWS